MADGAASETDGQKAKLIDQMWDIANRITAYGVAQCFAVLLLLGTESGRYIKHASLIVAPGLIVLGLVVSGLVRSCFRRELTLRRELHADTSIRATSTTAFKIRVLLVSYVHFMAAAFVVIARFLSPPS